MFYLNRFHEQGDRECSGKIYEELEAVIIGVSGELRQLIGDVKSTKVTIK